MEAKQKRQIHARKIIFVGFVALATLLLFIHGSRVGQNGSLFSLFEFIVMILIIGLTILYPEKYIKQTGLAISLLATLIVVFEILKGTISIEIVLSTVMLLCGVGIYVSE